LSIGDVPVDACSGPQASLAVSLAELLKFQPTMIPTKQQNELEQL